MITIISRYISNEISPEELSSILGELSWRIADAAEECFVNDKKMPNFSLQEKKAALTLAVYDILSKYPHQTQEQIARLQTNQSETIEDER